MSMGRFEAAGRRTWTAWSALVALVTALLLSGGALAQAPAAAGGAAPPPPADYLTGLVGRIALYPDDLVSIILPAATSPLQIVQADRYLDKRKADPKLPIDDKWDDPVKSLLNYPDVVKMMSNDLDWTSELGEAVVEDQGAVLAAVQTFRRQAQAAGNLKSDAKQVVKTEKEVVIIEPADPQVVYVPQYNPSTVVVYGAPAWGYYPTPYPSYYYPYAPGAALAAGVIWGAAIGAAWSGNRYGWGGGNDININRNTNISTGGNTINRGDNTINRGGQGGGSSSWKSNKQPGQVSSSVGKTPSNRAGDARGGAGAGGGARASAQPAGGAGRAGAAGAGDRGGASAANRGGGAGAGGGGSSAFGGYGSGHQAQMDSSRGASSRSSMSGGGGNRSASAGSRPAPSSASRGGGGGGGRAGGGGGGGRGGGGRR